MNVAIIGSRDFGWEMGPLKPSVENDYNVGWPDLDSPLPDVIEGCVKRLDPEDYVVSGAATGSDWWGEEFARAERVGRIIHPAHWKKYGTAAGMRRNHLIIRDAEVVLAFFSDKSKSRGTVGSIDLAHKKGLTVYEFDASVDTDLPPWYDTWYDETSGLSRIS